MEKKADNRTISNKWRRKLIIELYLKMEKKANNRTISNKWRRKLIIELYLINGEEN